MKKGLALFQVWLVLSMVFWIGFVSASDTECESLCSSGIKTGGGECTGTYLLGCCCDGKESSEVDSSTVVSTATTAVSGYGLWEKAVKRDDKTVSRSGGLVGTGDSASNTISLAEQEALQNNAAKNTDSWLANLFKTTKGSGASGLLSGLQWAGIAAVGGYLAGSLFGMSDNNANALTAAAAVGFGTYGFLSSYAPTEGALASGGNMNWLVSGSNPALIGLGVGVVIFALMYKDTETKIVTFECLPWQAESGQGNCEVCNDDTLPCSEYRCRSLGANCELVNAGTEEETCVNVNPKDVTPPVITPSENDLTSGLGYMNVKTSPPGPGFEIVNLESGNNCLPAFTSLSFGLVLDEPGQCKIDFDSTTSFDDMKYYVGGKNLYSYNHTEIFLLPDAETIDGSSGLVLDNGQDLEFYLRCQDKNGNANEAEYAVKLCVDPTPDSTAPKIEATSITNGGCVAEDTDNAEVIFYTNEPSNCKWDFDDRDYDSMSYNMSCSNELYEINAAQLYECAANLTAITLSGENYYVRCKDQPGAVEADRNKNEESFEFSLRGSNALILMELTPNDTVSGGTSPAEVELYAETFYGCEDGRSICYYGEDDSSYIMFFDTDNEDGISTQRLDLVNGNHTYHVKCVDAGGNVIENSTNFEVSIDTTAPVIARAYEEDGMLKIVTVSDSECAYTTDDCGFIFDEGTEMPYGNTTNHVADWDKSKTYYIKCRDEFQNEDSDCSMIVRPSTNFL